MVEPTIKITAEVMQHDPSSCKFTVDRVLSQEGALRFKDPSRRKRFSAGRTHFHA